MADSEPASAGEPRAPAVPASTRAGAPFRIGVVGAGIAGTAAALLLTRAGHRVTLLERAARLGPVGAGLLLQPSGQAVLRSLGLLDPVIASSEPIAQLRAVHPSGRTLIRLPYDFGSPESGPVTGYGVARGLLFGTLYDACRQAGVEIVPGTPIERRVRTPEGVSLGTADGRSFGPFDFVLGTDGSRSTLRGLLGEESRVHDYGFAALWAVGPCSAVRGELYQMVRGTTVLIGLLPTGGGRASFFWGCRRGEVEALKARGFEAFRREVLALCPLAEEVFSELRSFEAMTLGSYFHMALRRWHDDGLLLLGDAAHAMSPHLGQGANLALLDVAAFLRLLAETGDFVLAAQRVEAERRSQVRYYAQLSYLLTPFFQSGSRILGWGRNVALPVMTAIPPVRRRMSKTLAGLAEGWLR